MIDVDHISVGYMHTNKMVILFWEAFLVTYSCLIKIRRVARRMYWCNEFLCVPNRSKLQLGTVSRNSKAECEIPDDCVLQFPRAGEEDPNPELDSTEGLDMSGLEKWAWPERLSPWTVRETAELDAPGEEPSFEGEGSASDVTDPTKRESGEPKSDGVSPVHVGT